MWKNGSTPTSVSSGPTGIEFQACSMFATRLRWVSITPFISPVVPLEYGSTASSPGWTSTSAGFAPDSASAVNPAGSSITRLAPESLTCRSTSSGVRSGFIGVTITPARRIAW